MASRIWLSRLLTGIVTAWNVQAGIVFILWPETFVNAYELAGIPGEAAVRGSGILFLMWNVPYLYAVVDPIRYKLGLIFAILMQSIGLIGESYIVSNLPVEYPVLRASIMRFILFDGVGLLILFAAWILIKNRDSKAD